MNIWRVAGIVLMAGLALFLLSLLLKFLLILGATALLVRVIGGQLAGRFFRRMERRGRLSTDNVLSIDNPTTYRSAMNRSGFERVISIS